MRRASLLFGAVVAAAITSGCGSEGSLAVTPAGGASTGSPTTAAEEVEADDVGPDSETRLEGGTLPGGFPASLPLPQGLVVNVALPTGPSAYEVHGVIEDAAVEDVLTQLESELDRDGWRPELLHVDGSLVGLRALQGDGRYEIQITDLGEPPLLVLLQVRLP